MVSCEGNTNWTHSRLISISKMLLHHTYHKATTSTPKHGHSVIRTDGYPMRMCAWPRSLRKRNDEHRSKLTQQFGEGNSLTGSAAWDLRCVSWKLVHRLLYEAWQWINNLFGVHSFSFLRSSETRGWLAGGDGSLEGIVNSTELAFKVFAAMAFVLPSTTMTRQIGPLKPSRDGWSVFEKDNAGNGRRQLASPHPASCRASPQPLDVAAVSLHRPPRPRQGAFPRQGGCIPATSHDAHAAATGWGGALAAPFFWGFGVMQLLIGWEFQMTHYQGILGGHQCRFPVASLCLGFRPHIVLSHSLSPFILINIYILKLIMTSANKGLRKCSCFFAASQSWELYFFHVQFHPRCSRSRSIKLNSCYGILYICVCVCVRVKIYVYIYIYTTSTLNNQV